MSTRLQTIPRSEAKTAWGLLQDVKRVMLAEPKRVDMHCYACKYPPDEGGPACGTVGCLAGWVARLAGYPESLIHDDSARTILGALNYYTVGPLDSYVFNCGTGDHCGSTHPGTRAHARAVVARINRFMRINADALHARKLSPWKRRSA